MAIKAGELLHVGNGSVVMDRLQTGGPGNVNINSTRVYELGNYSAVGIVYDLPDLTFTAQSWDVTPDLEALLLGLDPVATPLAAHQKLQLSTFKPMFVASQFKAGRNAPDPSKVVGSVGAPSLYLERMEYRFGIADMAQKTATLRGGSIYYAPLNAATKVETAVGTGVAGQQVVTMHPATNFTGDNSSGPRRVLAVAVDGEPRFLGPDYSESDGVATGGAAIATITMIAPVDPTSTITIMYQTPDLTQYADTANNEGQPRPPLVKPAAIRGRDIEIFVADDGTRNPANKWGGVQTATATFSVNLNADQEMGNYQILSQDFITPDTNGTVDLKPRHYDDFKAKLDQISVTPTGETAGPYKSVPVPLDIYLKDPESGAVLETLHVDDAIFTMPGFQGQVNQKLTTTINWQSESGELYAFNGTRS
jgi:hypothetical protein